MPMPTSLVASESIFSTTNDAYRGRRAGAYSFGAGTETYLTGRATTDILGIYLSPTGGPLPVVVSSSFAAASDTGVGDSFILAINDRPLPVVIQDTVKYFPTMDPQGEGFILADLDLLLNHLNILAPESVLTPNEFFLSLRPTAGQEVREEIHRVSPSYAQVYDKESMMESQLETARLDPLVTVGWRAMALLSLAIVVFTAAIGYVTYLLFFSDRSRGEMALVRSLGLSHRQMIGLLVLEHLLIVIMGIGLGTWAGFQMSVMAVPAVTITGTEGSAVPPILVSADWRIIIAMYSALVATFAAMLFLLKRRTFHLDIQSISRVQE